MFSVRNLKLDTHSERVFFIHERAVAEGNLGFRPLDRIKLIATEAGETREITGILNFCRDELIRPDQIGLSDVAFKDLGLPEGTTVVPRMAPAPASVDQVRRKLRGETLNRSAFDEIVRDIAAHRYSKVELSMFVLACGLHRLTTEELIDLTRAMVESGSQVEFDDGPVADKHSIGGIPGNRTTMIVVPILASLGVTIPKTSSRAITSPSGTADTMSELANVSFSPGQMRDIVAKVGGCISWGGALDLAPADDVMITVERPMGIDTEAQMVASILAKKKTAGATHVLIDIPLGETSKIRNRAAGRELAGLFQTVGAALGLEVEVVITEARGPIGRGIGPRLEALDVLSVLHGEPGAPSTLREKSLYLAARLLEMVGAAGPTGGYRAAQTALDSGAAAAKFDEILDAQGRRSPSPRARHVEEIASPTDGRIRAIDCWAIAKVAKLAGAPAQPAAGVWMLREVGDVVSVGEPLFEIHAQTQSQLEFARELVEGSGPTHQFGY